MLLTSSFFISLCSSNIFLAPTELSQCSWRDFCGFNQTNSGYSDAMATVWATQVPSRKLLGLDSFITRKKAIYNCRDISLRAMRYAYARSRSHERFASYRRQQMALDCVANQLLEKYNGQSIFVLGRCGFTTRGGFGRTLGSGKGKKSFYHPNKSSTFYLPRYWRAGEEAGRAPCQEGWRRTSVCSRW